MNVPKNQSEEEISRKVELGTLWAGVAVAVASLAGLALTRGEFRPIGFLSTAGLGVVVAIIGAVQLRNLSRRA